MSEAGGERAGEPMLERDTEIGLLRAMVGGAVAGEGRLCLIEGRAGIGKSRLLGEVRRLAEARGLRILSARGSVLEREFGYGVARQLFERVIAQADARQRLLTGPAAGAMPMFESPAGVAHDGAGSFAVTHALYWLVVNLATEGPVLVAVDDLHWCDPASLRALAYLARRLEGLPVLMVATVPAPRADVLSL